jgi:anthranilate synthase component I
MRDGSDAQDALVSPKPRMGERRPTQSKKVEMHVCTRDFIADALTPISAYIALAQPGRSCLLESVEGTERIARYSFIGLDYLQTASFKDDPDMSTKVRALIGSYRFKPEDADIVKLLPFPGGAVCVFTYDAARVFEWIGPKLPTDIDVDDVLLFIPGTWIVFDHFTHRVVLIGFARDDRERGRVEERLDAYIVRLFDVRAGMPGEVRACGPLTASMEKSTFLERVAQAKHFIHEGDCYQLQLGIRFSCAFEGGPFDFYRRMRSVNPSPYMFFIEHEGWALFGASPEFLVRLDAGRAQLRPLAGTRPRGKTPQEDARIAAELLADEKERAEHVMLVDLGRNDLGRVCKTASVAVDELMQVERYSHVMHIVSHVTGTLDEQYDAFDLFAAAFPAGTVTGTPKIAAMRIIDQLEPTARGFYAGSVAHIDFDGDMDSCIILRCVLTVDGRAYWQASAGIVADSDPLFEYNEVLHKTHVVRHVLGVGEQIA